jgi:hypothetical protein
VRDIVCVILRVVRDVARGVACDVARDVARDVACDIVCGIVCGWDSLRGMVCAEWCALNVVSRMLNVMRGMLCVGCCM